MRTKAMVASLVIGLSGMSNHALAAEAANGTYLLGSKQEMAGALPPPGTYLSDFNYFYAAHANINVPSAGVTLSGGVDAKAYYQVPTLLWVTQTKILGGNLAFQLSTPIGYKDIRAGATLTGPLGNTIALNAHQTDTNFGDPVLGSSIGWHQGNWHWSVGLLYNAPMGYWERGRASSTGFNRSSLDTTFALTWLDPKVGLELSGAMGLTYNFENPATNYKTGNELHLEWAVMQHFSKTFSAGLVGYHYQQVTGDSGAGAVLGDFKGRVTALGPSLNYTFAVGQTPVHASLKYMKEFNTENRLEGGDVGFLNFAIPLSSSPHAAANPMK